MPKGGIVMSNWMLDEEWRKKVTGRNIYLMRDHNYAFSAWEIGRINGDLKSNSVLVHVDSHLDDVAESIEVPGILNDINTAKKAIDIAKQFDWTKGEMPERIYVRIDNFIWPAIVRNTIGDVYYISDDPQEESNESNLRKQISDPYSFYKRKDIRNDSIAELQLNNIIENQKKISRFQSIESFKTEAESFQKDIQGKTLILDLDLDYFNDSNIYNADPEIREEDQIRRNFDFVKNLANWDMITVALSPEHCGGEEACNYLLQLFLESFEINNDELIDW